MKTAAGGYCTIALMIRVAILNHKVYIESADIYFSSSTNRRLRDGSRALIRCRHQLSFIVTWYAPPHL